MVEIVTVLLSAIETMKKGGIKAQSGAGLLQLVGNVG